MRADGTQRRVLTPKARDDSDPSWSPDGSRIAFSYYDGRRERVAVLDLHNGRVRDLGEGFNPDWSPDGRRLVFLDAEGFEDLVVINADGTGRRSLGLKSTGIADETDPAWSPNGRRIAFVGDGLYVVGANGDNPRRIRHEGAAGAATWSPDGHRIAFDCSTRRFEVCLVRPDGTGLRGLTRAGRHPNWSPRRALIALTREDLSSGVVVVSVAGRVVRRLRGDLASGDWSPDGRRFVAEHEVGHGIRLYAIDATGRRIERLTAQRGAVDRAPAWSPDGTRIVFRRKHGRVCSLAVLDVNTRRTRVIVPRTSDRYCLDRPDWSARGRGVVYESAGDLWTVSPRGGSPRRVTSTSARESHPRWAPDGESIGFLAPGGIWVRHPDGSRRLLISGGGPFAWSRDGGSIAYSVYNSSTDEDDLYVRVGADPPRLLFEGIDGAPAWAPDGRRLALSHTYSGSGGGSVLVVVDLDGHAMEIADDPAGEPDWRP
jgi:Tol biopolymer transport system component